MISSIAHALLALQLLEQVEDLRLDRDVERGRRLVGDQEVGLGGQRHRDHHALLLPAGQAERVVVDAPLGLGDADPAAATRSPSRAPPRRAARCAPRSPRRSARRRVITGFRLVAGSWKIMPMRPPRTLRIRDSGSSSTSSPSSVDAGRRVTRPFSGSRRISASAVMLLPQPDSPTSAKVSPRSIARRQAVDRLDQAGVGVERDLQVVDRQHASSARRSVVASARAAAPRQLAARTEARARAGRRRRARRRRTGWRRAPASP